MSVADAIANLQQTEDTSLRYYAAWWLGKFRVSTPAAIAALLAALEDESDRAPDGGYPLRRNAARALGKLDAPQVVPALMARLEDSDFYVREAVAQSLEMLGDPQAIPPLLKLLAGGVTAAQPVPGKPHLTEPYEAIIEALGTLKATVAISAIEPFLEHSVAKVKYAAARAMYQLTQKDEYGQQLIAALKNPNLQLRRSALMDLGAIGYLKAADAIAGAFAENSLKLISLKGLLEQALNAKNPDAIALSEDSIHIMALMDSLL
ncbi:MAG: HEAT repeat domain-containing protein [Jaaginema sp. PMC 1079.18]|nr:HEAT repeat domain-containing protein [Jaaginema sp. PMC 1080.18]MEC4849828.1 HEAT repeat domain-containing protein [Jaaginema sp. PMC 1079.18]MEC4865530.1 HEAT repeat domain-containing protein [Jaaginema sp. PMC 1078.18]